MKSTCRRRSRDICPPRKPWPRCLLAGSLPQKRKKKKKMKTRRQKREIVVSAASILVESSSHRLARVVAYRESTCRVTMLTTLTNAPSVRREDVKQVYGVGYARRCSELCQQQPAESVERITDVLCTHRTHPIYTFECFSNSKQQHFNCFCEF